MCTVILSSVGGILQLIQHCDMSAKTYTKQTSQLLGGEPCHTCAG